MSTVPTREVEEFKVVAGGCELPVGIHRAKFVGVEETSHPEYGPGYCFVFRAVDPPYAGAKATRITAHQVTLRNATGRMFSCIMGRQLKLQETFRIAEFRGREYALVIEETQNGMTKITSVMPPNVLAPPAGNGRAATADH